MSRLTEVNFEATYNDGTTGRYRAGQAAGSIGSDDHRQMIEDVTDSFDNRLTVDYCATDNLTLTGNLAVDGATPAYNSYILVNRQSVPSENGIYIKLAGAWTKWYTFQNGDFIKVRYGTVHAGLIFLPSSATVCTKTVGFISVKSIDTSGATPTLNLYSLSDNVLVASALITSSKTFTIGNADHVARFEFLFTVNSSLPPLIFPSSVKMPLFYSTWNNGTKTWTPDQEGAYKMIFSYDGTYYLVEVVGPY